MTAVVMRHHLNVMCSSSLDFPEEYGVGQDVLALIRKVR